MIRSVCRTRSILVLALVLLADSALAQFYPPTLGNGPWTFSTFEQENLKVSVVTRGMAEAYGMVFLPGTASEEFPTGDILFTERRTGLVRLFRNGELLAAPAGDLKAALPLEQLFDINLHPRFADNGLLYFTWSKRGENPDGSGGLWMTTAVVRGRWDGNRVVDLEEVFEADAWAAHPGGASTRGIFLPDGTFVLGSSHRIEREAPQSLGSHIGKVLRINDDGSAPANNPYYAVEGALPEIYTWGNRSVMDFALHPETGDLWELENGPQGGDEVNVVRPGANYGWPLATYGRDYDGTQFNDVPWVEGTQRPEVFWVPAITVAGMTFYTGDRFPGWMNNLFVTSMMVGRIPGTGHLERVVFNENGEVRRESLLDDLGQRIRYVAQGPDGLLYVLTDHTDAVLLKLEPGETDTAGMESLLSELSDQGLGNPELFAASDCLVCHRVTERFVGPSLREIAARYPPTEDTINQLVNSIIQGGDGKWGDVPMTSHPDMATTTAREMVELILALD